jgi:hypothetical protein
MSAMKKLVHDFGAFFVHNVTRFERPVSEVMFPLQTIRKFVGNRLVEEYVRGNEH